MAALKIASYKDIIGDGSNKRWHENLNKADTVRCNPFDVKDNEMN